MNANVVCVCCLSFSLTYQHSQVCQQLVPAGPELSGQKYSECRFKSDAQVSREENVNLLFGALLMT